MKRRTSRRGGSCGLGRPFGAGGAGRFYCLSLIFTTTLFPSTSAISQTIETAAPELVAVAKKASPASHAAASHAAALSPAAAAKPGQAAHTSPWRLPDGASPNSYKLYFEPDLVKFTFAGKETLNITVTKPIAELVLNAAELQIANVAVAKKAAPAPAGGKGRAKPAPASGGAVIKMEPARERVHFVFPHPLQPGDYDVQMTFKGVLNDKLRGFYRSTFTDSDGKVRTIATTQMEPTDARRMFPCFDEPAYKATFQITAAIPSDLTAISNSKLASTNLDEKTGKVLASFEETPKMSSYLVALVIGPFDSTQPRNVDGVPVRVWFVSDRPNMGNFARDIAASLLPFYNEYFGVPYPAKKLDLIAVPDFEAGAMENLGCITFREKRLLVDTPTASMDQRMAVTSVIAHEMAHMWFGDLVTMSWWDDLWLNEAFATWMSIKACDHLNPDWHTWDEFGHAHWRVTPDESSSSRWEVMTTDSLASSRPIHFTVDNPEQANEMFDDITYTKGASILRMLETYVGEDVFRDGVRKYISDHAFANATTNDLWQGISDSSKKDVGALMKNWVSKAGYPVLTVQHPSEGKIGLHQDRFYSVAKPSAKELEGYLWQVPMAVHALSTDAHETFQLGTRDGTMESGKISAPFTVNGGGNGYFRAKYPADLLKQLGEARDKLTVGEKLSLLSDTWAFTFSGELPVDQFLDLTANYKHETDPNVVNGLIESFQQLYNLVDDKERSKVSQLVRDRLGETEKKLGWEKGPIDTVNTVVLRGDVIGAMGTIGADPETIEQCRKLFASYVEAPQGLDPNLVEAVTAVVAFNGTEKDYDQITTLWKNAKTPADEKRNLLALGLFRDSTLANKTLSMCLTDQVRTQDAPNLLRRVFSEPATCAQAWTFIKTRWNDITTRFPLNTVPKVIHAAATLKTEAEERDLQAFLQAHPIPAGQSASNRAMERVKGNAQFIAHSGAALSQWLDKNMQPAEK